MARPMKPLVRGGGYYPSNRWIPLVYPGGYTTMNSGGEPTPSVVWVTVSGASPLSLVNAAASNIRSITQTGKTVQSGTPTPTNPVDIVCNNGPIKYGALGANLLDPSAANTVLAYYINKADGVEESSPYNFMFAGYMPVEAGKTYVAYGRAKTDNDISDYNRVAWYDSTKTWISGADYTQNSIAVVTAPANAAYARFSCNPSGGTSVAVTQAIVDSYNWTFAEGTAEITPFVPFVGGIYVDGTPETLTVGKNLFSQDSYLDAYCSAGGTITAHNSSRCFVMECKPNTEYRFIFDNSASSSPRCVINGFAAQPEIGMRSKQVCYSSSNTSPMLHDTTFTTGADVHYLVMWLMYQKSDDDTKAAVNKAILMETATAQTASAPDLFAVGDYADTQGIIGGAVTRRVGIKVLDWTETWIEASVKGVFYCNMNLPSSAGYVAPAISSHFTATTQSNNSMPDCSCKLANTAKFGVALHIKYTTYAGNLADWKSYLAAQYAAGTPVIALYPLAEETTESVTPQPLRTEAGDNTVSVVSEVDPVNLSVEYAKAGA